MLINDLPVRVRWKVKMEGRQEIHTLYFNKVPLVKVFAYGNPNDIAPMSYHWRIVSLVTALRPSLDRADTKERAIQRANMYVDKFINLLERPND